MKKNRTMRIATLMLALTLITCCFVGSTFAKYTSSANGSDSVKVAKWEINVTNEDTDTLVDITGTTDDGEVTFSIFDTINDEADGSDEADVKDNLIAPGTTGSFEFTIANASEVTAEYGVTYTVVNTNNIPLEYSLNGTDGWTTNLASFNVELDDDADTNDLAMLTGSKTITVYWRWAFTPTVSTDVADTALGVLGQDEATRPEIEVTVKIDVQQVD